MLLKITAPMLLAAFVAAPALAQSGPMPARPTLLVHGNYCGPDNNAPLAPVDALDAACARHDACTPDHGLPSKACNLRLEAEAERVASDPRRPEDLRMMAGLVASVAAMLPARPSDPATVVAARARPGPVLRRRTGGGAVNAAFGGPGRAGAIHFGSRA